MNKVLLQYKQMVDHASGQTINAWITEGDWTLLTSNRKTLEEQQKTGKLNPDEVDDLKALDEKLRNALNDDQLKQLEKMEPDMPVMKWWKS